MAKRKWTDEEREILKQQVQQDKSCREIAKVLNRSTKSVQHKFNQLGLSRPKLCVGDKINRLTIIELYDRHRYGQHQTYAKCLCDCGNIKHVKLTSIKQNGIKSCGCLRDEKARERTIERNTTHGLCVPRSKLYGVWAGMKTRCNNVNATNYKRWGGRGISVCDEWHDFQAFYNWSMSHGYQEGLTLDRIDNDGNYEPGNCRWTDHVTQAKNRPSSSRHTINITAFGETKTLTQWLEDQRCPLKSSGAICYRIGAGWTPEDAISKPSERP